MKLVPSSMQNAMELLKFVYGLKNCNNTLFLLGNSVNTKRSPSQLIFFPAGS